MPKLTFLKFFEPFEWVFLCSSIKKENMVLGARAMIREPKFF